MRFRMPTFSLLSIVCLASGCASTQDVRFVYQDGDFGVVGLPENTDCWPSHYRRKAEKLMDAHFPEGHEIIRAEEVVEGERTVKLDESKTAEVGPPLPNALIGVGKIGRSASTSQSDTIKLKECRIIYRRVGDPERHEGYASASGLSPGQYVDPNAEEHRKAVEGGWGSKKPAKPSPAVAVD